MNLHNIIRPAITVVVPDLPISLKIYNSATNDNSGLITASYTIIAGLSAQVHLVKTQQIKHKHYFNENGIYKKFYLNSNNLTGLNRNLNTGGDRIILQGLNYKIVELLENFQTGWVCVIGCESTDEVTG